MFKGDVKPKSLCMKRIKCSGISKVFVDDKKKQLDDLIKNSSVSTAELNDKKKKLDDAKEAAAEPPANPVPTTITSIRRLLAGLTTLMLFL